MVVGLKAESRLGSNVTAQRTLENPPGSTLAQVVPRLPIKKEGFGHARLAQSDTLFVDLAGVPKPYFDPSP